VEGCTTMGTENPYPAHEKGTQTGDDPIGGAQVRRTLAAAIENQQSRPDQRGFGDHGTEPPGLASRATVKNK